MLQRVTMQGIPLPRLYIAENMEDIRIAKANGIPYIKWNKGQDKLIKFILRPFLEKMFPDIKWDKVLGRRPRFKTVVEMTNGCHCDDSDTSDGTPSAPNEDEDGTLTEVADIAEDYRTFDRRNGGGDVESVDLSVYVGDLSSHINLEVLQSLRLMPAFIGDILECIKINVGSGQFWQEGYNKKRKLYVGNYNCAAQLPNLIILDISYSIPRGISSTMLMLIDTLRSQVNADLIVTGRHTKWFPMNEPLPSPQELRKMIPLGQESAEFVDIMNKHVAGKHYGHVFSFGDNDSPYVYGGGKATTDLVLIGTEVEHVHSYHTRDKRLTGYCRWCEDLAKKPQVSYDTTWCKVIRD